MGFKGLKTIASFTPFTGFGAIGGGGFLGKGGMLDKAGQGATATQTIPPSAMDLFNAKVIAALAPIFFAKMAPGLAGQNTAEGAGQNREQVSQGAIAASQQHLAPGTSQMFSMVDSMGQPGSAKKTADMMLLMYGKQPNIGPMGGNETYSPGMTDYTNTAAHIANVFAKSQNPFAGQLESPAYQPRPIVGPTYNMPSDMSFYPKETPNYF